MLKIVLIDDENNAIKTLQSYIQKYLDKAIVVGIANNKAEAIQVIDSVEFDLLLLDINLGDGTGFEVLENVKNKNFNVIFCTAYDEYAVKAFKYSALDYLLKPLNPEEFINAVKRVKSTTNKTHHEQIEVFSDFMNSKVNKKIIVNSASEIIFLNLKDIIRLESDKNYTDVFTLNNKKITASKTLKYYENLLPESKFFRIHQKHIVNIDHVIKFLKEDGGYVVLADGSKVEVSRRRKDELLNKLISRV